jgi:hypothetical protein
MTTAAFAVAVYRATVARRHREFPTDEAAGLAFIENRYTSRIAAVNFALTLANRSERLVRAKDYYYFTGGDAMSWPESGVYGVARAGDLTLAQWLHEFDVLKDRAAQGFGGYGGGAR